MRMPIGLGWGGEAASGPPLSCTCGSRSLPRGVKGDWQQLRPAGGSRPPVLPVSFQVRSPALSLLSGGPACAPFLASFSWPGPGFIFSCFSFRSCRGRTKQARPPRSSRPGEQPVPAPPALSTCGQGWAAGLAAGVRGDLCPQQAAAWGRALASLRAGGLL